METMLEDIGKKLIGDEDERAVSPVIGVILMVAITVILAAVIAAFVLDLGDSVDQNPQAAISIDDNNELAVEISVTSLDSADGVVIVNDEGNIEEYDDGVLTATGATVEVGDEGDIDTFDEGDNFTVQAYFGAIESGDEGEPVDDVVDSNAVVGEFTADDNS